MALSREDMDRKIRELFFTTFEMQNEGLPLPQLDSGTVLLETGADSLCFAILVARLEEDLGFDPFSQSGEAYYPVTYQDFLNFYFVRQPT